MVCFIYWGQNGLWNVGGDLFIYGMYPGYPFREALDALTQERFISAEIWLLKIEKLPGTVESNIRSIKATINWENEKQQV